MTRHTGRHMKDETGRSSIIEPLIQQSNDFIIDCLNVEFYDPDISRYEDIGRDFDLVLDLGCDYGFQLEDLTERYLKESSTNTTLFIGCDPYHTHNPFNLDLRKLAMDDPQTPHLLYKDIEGEVDNNVLILMNHSLEHVANPHAVLANINVLRSRMCYEIDGMYMYIGLPHADSAWATWDNHYTLWNEKFLAHFMKMNGWETMNIETRELRPGNVEIWGMFTTRTTD